VSGVSRESGGWVLFLKIEKQVVARGKVQTEKQSPRPGAEGLPGGWVAEKKTETTKKSRGAIRCGTTSKGTPCEVKH